MACPVWRLCKNINFQTKSNLLTFIRHGHHIRGKPPGVAKTLKQYFAELRYKDPSLHFRVDISLAPVAVNKRKQTEERLKILKQQRHDAEFEKLSRNNELVVDLDKVNEEWLKTTGPQHIHSICDHYGVYEHLFGEATFMPVVPLKVQYQNADLEHTVYYGNILKPSETAQKPEVTFSSEEGSYWSLILTNPDGHFTQQDKEYVHWFVGNIPGNKVAEGETIVEYLQPFPPKGTGYHRHIFILYKHEKKLDFSGIKKPGDCLNLEERTFSTLDFYRERQDDITPGGIAFFQSDWDPSLTDFYHNHLNMKEPTFLYDFPEPYIRPEEWFAIRKPFNLYLDKYRDPKDVNQDYLVRKLKKVHPFKAPPPPLPFPNAVEIHHSVPSWLKLEKRKSRLKWGRINEIEDN